MLKAEEFKKIIVFKDEKSKNVESKEVLTLDRKLLLL